MKKKHIEGLEKFRTITPFSKSENRPAFLNKDYLYPSTNQIVNDNFAKNWDTLIEIKCMNNDCKMSVRLQGSRAEGILSKLRSNGCPVCKRLDFKLYYVKI